MTYRCQLVKAGKEFIECHDQLLSGALRGQAGETLDVCKQDTVGERERLTDGVREGETNKHYRRRWPIKYTSLPTL